jgi:hypothetical protein
MPLSESPQPLKRDPALRPLSRDHHHALLLGWKIRQGQAAKVAPGRMMRYVRAFYEEALAGHFEEEERLLFPLLGAEHPLVPRALAEHRRLEGLFATEQEASWPAALGAIERELVALIRFEERELFQEIQEKTAPAELEALQAQLHPREKGDPLAHWPDPFWRREAQG